MEPSNRTIDTHSSPLCSRSECKKGRGIVAADKEPLAKGVEHNENKETPGASQAFGRTCDVSYYETHKKMVVREMFGTKTPFATMPKSDHKYLEGRTVCDNVQTGNVEIKRTPDWKRLMSMTFRQPHPMS